MGLQVSGSKSYKVQKLFYIWVKIMYQPFKDITPMSIIGKQIKTCTGGGEQYLVVGIIFYSDFHGIYSEFKFFMGGATRDFMFFAPSSKSIFFPTKAVDVVDRSCKLFDHILAINSFADATKKKM